MNQGTFSLHAIGLSMEPDEITPRSKIRKSNDAQKGVPFKKRKGHKKFELYLNGKSQTLEGLPGFLRTWKRWTHL